MEQKVVKQFLSIIDDETLKKIFDLHIITEKIKINGFNPKKTDKIPKPIYIQALIKNSKNYENLIKLVKTKYPYEIEQGKYKDMPFDEAINISTPIERPYIIAAYMLEEEKHEEKNQAIQFLGELSDAGKKNKITGTEKNMKSEMSIGNEEEIENDSKNKLLELENEIVSLRNTINQYKNKTEEIKKENTENKKKLKLLRQQRKEMLEDVRSLNEAVSSKDLEIEDLKSILKNEKIKYENLQEVFNENKKQLDKITKVTKEYIAKNKIGILYDKEINEDLDGVYVVTNADVNILLNNLEIFEKVYILERTVSERIRRSFIKKEKDINKKILEFVYDDDLIKEIIEGAKNNGE